MSILLWLLGGALLGAAIITISYTVSRIISRYNLRRITEEALQSSQGSASDLLAQQIEIYVQKKEGNTVSLSVLSAISGDEKAKIELTGEGVDSSVYAGMKLKI